MYYARIILNSSHTLYIQSCDSVPLQKHLEINLDIPKYLIFQMKYLK